MTPLDRVRRYVEETAGCEDWIDGPHWAQLLRSDLRAVLALVADGEWRPIETAPKDDVILLTDGGYCMAGFWQTDQWLAGWSDGNTTVRVTLHPTHWRPMQSLTGRPVTP